METSIRSRPKKLSQPPEWHTGSFWCLSQQDNYRKCDHPVHWVYTCVSSEGAHTYQYVPFVTGCEAKKQKHFHVHVCLAAALCLPPEAMTSHTIRRPSFQNCWFWFSVWVWVVPSWMWRKYLNLDSLLFLIWCYWPAMIKWITQSLWPGLKPPAYHSTHTPSTNLLLSTTLW